jgi:hypothetical protein
MLNDLEQKYQQLITAKKWEGVGHIGETLTQDSSFNAAVEQEEMEHLKNGPKRRSVIIVARKATLVPSADSI